MKISKNKDGKYTFIFKIGKKYKAWHFIELINICKKDYLTNSKSFKNQIFF
jgi:hypothetical protein